MPAERFDTWGSYLYPGTNVLKNKLDIRDANELHKAEYEITWHRIEKMRAEPVPGKLDFDHLKKIHREIFQDVYEWAGQPREVGIAKGNSNFTDPQYIEWDGAELSDELKKENYLRGLDKDQFVSRLAEHYTKWNALHPFREGNGRSTREFMGAIAQQAGYTLDQNRIEQFKDRWNKAAARSNAGDLSGIQEIFKEAIRPTRSIAFETLPRNEAIERHPELRESFTKLRIKQAELSIQHPNNDKAKAHFLAQTKTELTRHLDTGKIPALTTTERANVDAAQAFLSEQPAQAARLHPKLAGPLAALGAYGAALKEQGIDPEQRQEVVQRMRNTLTNRILAGQYRSVETQQMRFKEQRNTDQPEEYNPR